MSKKLNHSLAIGIFLIGLFSASVSQAQSTNVWWKPSTGLGGGELGTAVTLFGAPIQMVLAHW